MSSRLAYKRSLPLRVLMQVVWPAFLSSVVTCGLVFSAVDPEQITFFNKPVPFDRNTAYTVGFVLIWLQYIAAGWLVWWVVSSDAERVARRE